MGKRQLKQGDRVEFDSFDEQCRPYKQQGIVRVYKYPDFHPSGYVEVVDEQGEVILYGNAGSLRKINSSKLANDSLGDPNHDNR